MSSLIESLTQLANKPRQPLIRKIINHRVGDSKKHQTIHLTFQDFTEIVQIDKHKQ